MSTRIMLRNSERIAQGRCPTQWKWAWREGLKGDPAKALWFGQGIHLALAHYYQKGFRRDDSFIEVWRTFADDEGEYVRTTSSKGLDEQEFVEAKELGEAMLQGYHAEYGGDSMWNVVATEQPFQVRIPFDYSSMIKEQEAIYRAWLTAHGYDPDYFELDGTFDGVVYDMVDETFKLIEHKTGQFRIAGLWGDNQAGTYWAVAHTVLRNLGVLKPRENISEITYNFLAKKLPDERDRNADGHYLNKDGSVSKRQPAPLFMRYPVTRRPKERKTQIERVKAEALKGVAYRAGIIPITKTPGDYCSWCPFREMCELHEQKSNWEDFRDMVFVPKDPYADHRKVA